MKTMTKYVDPPAEKIAEQLENVKRFKEEHPNLADLIKICAWEKWCTSYEYRVKEWEWRQQYFANRE